MIYNEINVIQNVYGVDSLTHTYSYEKNGISYLHINNQDIVKEEYSIEIISKQNIIIPYYSGKSICELYIDGKFSRLYEETHIFRGDNEMFLEKSILDIKTFKSHNNLIDVFTGKPILSKHIPYELYVHQNTIVAYNNFTNEIKRINTNTETLWHFPFSEIGANTNNAEELDEIMKILGVAHGNLWFSTRLGRLIALNIETGKPAVKISGSPYDSDKDFLKTRGLGRGCYFREEDANIVCISSRSFQVVDTKTGTIAEIYSYSEADPQGIGKYKYIYSPLLQGNYFTFLAEKEGDTATRTAGIFDYNAKKLVWECEIISLEEREKTGNELIHPERLYMSKNKLYIKDSQKNLHIFERE